MARELGLNPKKFGILANTDEEPWRVPLPELLEELYFKHFKRRQPDNIRSIEQMVSDYHRKKHVTCGRCGIVFLKRENQSLEPAPWACSTCSTIWLIASTA